MTEITAQSLKEDVRSRMRRTRSILPTAVRDAAAEALCRQVASLNLRAGSTIAGYWPVGTEIDTRPLLTQLHKDGHTVALARTMAPMTALRFCRWTPGMNLVSDILGFPTAPAEDEVTPDIVLVPLLAFDDYGYRLGQGAGFYDRTLQALRRHHPTRAIGIAFACQRTDALPVEPHDEKLDSILTEAGLVLPQLKAA